MSSNSLDNLAANHIIDFDAHSYIKGEPPRYVGDPDGYVGLPFERPLPACNEYGVMPGPKLHGEPKHDAFISSQHEEKSSNWKGFLFGALVATLGAVGLYKFADKIKGALSKASTTKQTKASTTGVKVQPNTTTTKEIENTAKKSFGERFKEGFKSFKEKAVEVFKTGKEKFNALPTKAKVATKIAAGLGGLYVVYKMFFSKGESGPPAHH